MEIYYVKGIDCVLARWQRPGSGRKDLAPAEGVGKKFLCQLAEKAKNKKIYGKIVSGIGFDGRRKRQSEPCSEDRSATAQRSGQGLRVSKTPGSFRRVMLWK